MTAEATPHHLLLTEELTSGYDPIFKVNPPLRTNADVLAVREGVADGTIDIVATDHAPHPAESKDCAFDEAAFGMLGLEVAINVVQKALVETGLLTWSDVARVLSTAPASIGGVDGYETPFALGAPAHLALHDPSGEKLATMRYSKSQNNPYRELMLPGSMRYTFYRGVATVVDGDVVDLGALS